MKGWKREPARHSLAARGVKTNCIPRKSYASSSQPGQMALYDEVEFLCANSNFNGWEEVQKKHELVFKELSKLKGVYPYRQDFSGVDGIQQSLAVIVLDKRRMNDVKRIAEKYTLPIDMVLRKDEIAVDKIIDGEYEFKMGGNK